MNVNIDEDHKKSKKFQNFIKSLKKSNKEKSKESYVRTREYLNNINSLYTNCGIWLEPYEDINLTYSDIEIVEENIRYNAIRLTITLFDKVVTLTPIHSETIGGNGTMYMENPSWCSKFQFIVNKEEDKWYRIESFYHKYEPQELNENTFIECLMELLKEG